MSWPPGMSPLSRRIKIAIRLDTRLCEQRRERTTKRERVNMLFVKGEKCEFHFMTISFLGCILSQGQLQPNPAKQLQQFLGFANFYRRFMKDYSKSASLLPSIPLCGRLKLMRYCIYKGMYNGSFL